MPVEEDELKALQESAKSHDQNVANTSLSIQASSSTSVQHGGSPSSDTTITCANDPAMHNSRSFKYCNTDDSFTLESTSGTTAKIAHNNIQCPSENSLIGTNVQGNLRNCSSNSNLKRSVPSNGDTVQGKNCFPVERETLELIELSSSDDEREPSRKRWKEASICNTSSVDRNTHGYISGISEHPYVPDVHRKLPSDWGTMRSVNAVGKGSMKVLQSNVITNDRIHDGRDLVHDHANVNSRKVQQHTSTGSMDSGSEEFSVRGVSLYEISGWNSSRSPNDDSSRLQRQNMSNINQKQNSLEAKPQPGHFQQNDGLCFDLNSKYIPPNQHSPSPFQCNVIDGKTKISDKRIWNHGLVNGEMLKHKNKRLLPPSLGARGHPSVIAQHVSSSKEEKRTYRAALMDLEQPTTEASPDDGLLAVPLLKHQRIALAWMVEKENTNQFCAGGILADDQGLGKTVSAISLILKERPRKSPQDDLNRMKAQSCTVNLDEDEAAEALCELSAVKPSCSLHLAGTDVCEQASVPTIKRGRPSAGTLVVCPTSVLRQWAQEIQDKVTQEANLRVLVYHGSNRTKDPEEVAKYDVVLTTYSIVSQEVPKQEAYEEQEETDDAALCAAFTKKRKRKISDSKKVKKRKGKNASSSDPGPGVLARINWFRVVLDEAQTIKNHRTQVSRACWSLRAKKRWCLSGTPIQNSIDDLYSYFRFLRHELFASYKSFCDIIKLPISRDPNTGYKKLQLILRTVMLRRTKATLIDGEPVISLPPKTITLNKVDFSKEERDFYCRLEAESRAQFRVYAAEGTVKQNYVNILLMLLHLRQACNHPLLVKNSSTKNWTSSLKAVKKLSREKQIDLMKNLEGSVALCCICNDAPEEAVISLCNHIFCNQCIADYFAQRDDTVCPSPNCKSDINKENIFSANALRHCIRNGDDDDDTNPLQEDNYSKFEIPDFGSSKIKAALEVLKSITQVRSGISSKSAISDESGRHVRVSEWSAENSVDMLDPQDPDPEPAQKKRIIERPEKAIVFSQWTSMLDLLEGALQKSGIQYRRLDGTMSVCARDKAVNDFKTLPEVTVMIMSLKAASLGLNMVAASHVIMLDLWWNPTTEDQAIDRAHRIGQTRHVHVCRLTVKDTVEDRILALQEKKREMVSSAFGEDDSGRHGSRLTEEDLHYLFRL